MKKFEQVFCILFLVFTLIITADNILANDDEIKVKIDDTKINFDEESGMPFFEDERTLVPLRRAMENICDDITWDQENQFAILTKEDIKVIVPLNTNFIYVNDNMVDLDKPAKVVNERIYLPIRYVSEAFNYEVEWNGETNSVLIYSEEYKLALEEKLEEEKVPESLDETNGKVRYIEGHLNVRSSCEITADNIIGELYTGDRVTIVDELDEWYEIKFKHGLFNNTAFVWKEHIKKDSLPGTFEMPTVDVLIEAGITDDSYNRDWVYSISGSDKWNDLIYDEATYYGLDPIFVKVVLACESNGNQYCIGAGTYYGLMQVGKRWGYDCDRMLNDPKFAIDCGCEVLIAHNAGSIYKTMCGYGGGSNYFSEKYNAGFLEVYETLSGEKTRDDSIYMD